MVLIGLGVVTGLVILVAVAFVAFGDDADDHDSVDAAPTTEAVPVDGGADDLRQIALGTYAPGEAIPVTLEEGDVSFLLTVVGEDDQEILTVTRVTDPDGVAIYEVDDDLVSATGGLTAASRGGYEPGEASIIAPVHPGLDVRRGTYEIEIDNLVSVEADVLIKSGDVSADTRQAVDLNVWLVSTDHDQATLERDLKAQMNAVFEPQNLEVGSVIFTAADPDDVDTMSTVDAEDSLRDVCRAMRDDVGLGRALNLALIESFLDDSTIGLASGLPGAPQVPIAGADCVVAATRVEDEVLPLPNLASTIVHEGAHFMGLPHTAEEDGLSFDDFEDTADCDLATFDGRDNFGYEGEVDELISATECGLEGGAENFMFFEDSPPDTREVLTQTVMTPDQAWALRRHPLFYATGSGAPAPSTGDTPDTTVGPDDTGPDVTADVEPTDPGTASGLPDPDPAAGIADYGTDADLDALADACEAGDLAACDDLFLESPFDSAYEAYGDSCGGRNIPGGYCTTIYGDR